MLKLKERSTECTYTKYTHRRQTSQIVCERNEEFRPFTNRSPSKNRGLEHVNSEKTGKFAESFCKPGLGIIF